MNKVIRNHIATLPLQLPAMIELARNHDFDMGLMSVAINQVIHTHSHGHLDSWLEILTQLKHGETSQYDFTQPRVQIGGSDKISASEREHCSHLLQQLMPWRKGPFNYFGIEIDAEWRSDHKWARLIKAMSPLSGRRVLDIGCGNGYYALRMLGAGARWVLGLDPSLLFLVQFQALTQTLNLMPAISLLPVGIESLPNSSPFFDTVFSMGVLYHRKDPVQHIQQIQAILSNGGECVLETLVIPGEAEDLLQPSDRYAQMRNVYCVPTVALLKKWLLQSGFRRVRCVDINQTSIQEQRSTPWMSFHSLSQYLDPNNPALTIEGYPRPLRAVLIAQKA